MSTSITDFPFPIRVIKSTTHIVRHYEGTPEAVIKIMQAEHRTGILMVFFNEGFVYKLEYDSRLRPTKD